MIYRREGGEINGHRAVDTIAIRRLVEPRIFILLKKFDSTYRLVDGTRIPIHNTGRE